MDARYDESELARLKKIGIIPTKCSVEGKHSYQVRNVSFVIDKRYELIDVLGMGAYGLVVSAKDRETGEKVAIKRISDLFESVGDGKRILREIRLMRFLKCEQILAITDMEVPESSELLDFNVIYLVSPMFDKDLERVLRAGVELKDEHIQYFLYQILLGCHYMHSASILHRDLKPANILVQESCDLVLCDLGLARYIHQSNEVSSPALTEYVVTRWYRAPELVLCGDSYGTAVDMWACGCILAELILGKVLFPGKDFRHQVELICSVIGKPSEKDCQHIDSPQAKAFVDGLPDKPATPLRSIFGDSVNPHAVDICEKLLVFDPANRMTAKEALEHPYLAEYHDPECEPTAQEGLDTSWLEPKGKDGAELDAAFLRELMLKEISFFRPDDQLFKENPHLRGE